MKRGWDEQAAVEREQQSPREEPDVVLSEDFVRRLKNFMYLMIGATVGFWIGYWLCQLLNHVATEIA